MGYHIRTGLVEEFKTTLEMIASTIDKGEAIRFDCPNPEQMNKLKYQLNRILRASSVLKDECNGDFNGLREMVQVCEDWKIMAIVVKPVHGPLDLRSLKPAKANEYDTIDRLKQFEGIMDLVRFTPTAEFDLAEWQLALNEIGFDLMANPDEPGWIGDEYDDGSMEYAVARNTSKKPTGFSMLKSFESSGDINQEG